MVIVTFLEESAIKTNTQGELHVRIKVCPCPYFNDAYAPMKLTIKSILITTGLQE